MLFWIRLCSDSTSITNMLDTTSKIIIKNGNVTIVHIHIEVLHWLLWSRLWICTTQFIKIDVYVKHGSIDFFTFCCTVFSILRDMETFKDRILEFRDNLYRAHPFATFWIKFCFKVEACNTLISLFSISQSMYIILVCM